MIRWLTSAPWALLVGGIAGWLAWLWFEPPWLTYTNVPFPARVIQVRAGEVVPVTVARCSTATEPRAYDVTRQLERQDQPAQPVLLPLARVTADPGCVTATSRLHAVPPGTPPGIYRLTGRALIEGSLHSHVVPWHSQPFEVVVP